MINNICLFSKLFIMTWLLPTHTTETLEQTLGNATIIADKSIEAAYIASNTSAFLTTLNTGIKALSVGYGVALMVSSATEKICFWVGRKVNAVARVGDIPAI